MAATSNSPRWRPPDAVLYEACVRWPLHQVAAELGITTSTLRAWRRTESYRAHAAEVEARAAEVMAQRRADDLAACAQVCRDVMDGYEAKERIQAAKLLSEIHRAPSEATAARRPGSPVPDRTDLLARVTATISAAGPLTGNE